MCVYRPWGDGRWVMDVCRCGVDFCRSSSAREAELAGDLSPVRVRMLLIGDPGTVAGCTRHAVGVKDGGLVASFVLAPLGACFTLGMSLSECRVRVGKKSRSSD